MVSEDIKMLSKLVCSVPLLAGCFHFAVCYFVKQIKYLHNARLISLQIRSLCASIDSIPKRLRSNPILDILRIE